MKETKEEKTLDQNFFYRFGSKIDEHAHEQHIVNNLNNRKHLHLTNIVFFVYIKQH